MLIGAAVLALLQILLCTCFATPNFDGVQPVIFSIFPPAGSIMGGTAIKIYGFNFAPGGFFSEMVVYIGNEECKIIRYYTSNDQIYCITPKCDSDNCRVKTRGWTTKEVVDVSVYVTTVVGILGAHSSFTYATSATPSVTALTKNLWASCTASLTGYMDTSALANIELKIDGHFASFGSNDELNPDDLMAWHYSKNWAQTLHFRPPKDITAGFYNLSLVLNNANIRIPDLHAGLANLFPDDSSKTFYAAIPSGVVYSSAMYPVITQVFPIVGGIAGGTTITIDGYGFSSSVQDMTVLVAGVPCTVQSSSLNQVTCITNKIEYSGTVKNVIAASPRKEPYTNTDLSQGSPGAFVKIFDFNKKFIMSFNWHQDLAMYQLWDNTTPYTAEVGTVIVAPFDGDYSFFVWVDDDVSFYYSLTGYGINEKFLWTTTYSDIAGGFYTNSNQRTRAVFLPAKQRFFLRAVWRNTGGPNGLRLAVKIAIPSVVPLQSFANYHVNSMYNTLKEVQQIQFSFGYRREIQQIVITGYTSGSFYLVVQDSSATALLTGSSTSSEVTSSIKKAASSIPSSSVECTSFWVTSGYVTSSRVLTISVEFLQDSPKVFTLLKVVPVSLNVGAMASINRTQAHSVYPSGTFSLSILGNTVNSISYAVEAAALKDMINTLSNNLEVKVTRIGSNFNGYVWTLAFSNPREDIPLVSVDTSSIVGDSFTPTVKTLVNGANNSFFFDPIPLWMTEIPIGLSTDNKTRSSIEIFQKVAGNFTMKAICDGSGDTVSGFVGLAKGNETTCGYTYLVSKTPSVTSYTMTTTITAGVPSYHLSFVGAGFRLGEGNISVAVGNKMCIGMAASDSFASCSIVSVPWGSHTPFLTVIGIGAAVMLNDSKLMFRAGIISVIPSESSFAGGQLITISGYGFSPSSSQVNIFNSMDCNILSMTTNEIKCVTPAVPATYFVNMNTISANITVDDVASVAFYYTASSTPVVTSLSATELSSADDLVFNITGFGFQGFGATVTLGESACIVLQASDVFLSCFLPRTLSSSSYLSLSVKVYIPSKGFGGLYSKLNTLPSVSRGFEIKSIFPSLGSIYGGTVVKFTGMGFISGIEVSFSDEISSSTYGKLILALGIDYSPITSHVQKCKVVAVSFTSLECALEILDVAMSDNATISASIISNDISPFFSDDSSIEFHQTLSATPAVESIHTIQRSKDGITTFSILGTLLSADMFSTEVKVGTVSCSSVGTGQLLTVTCFNLTAGQYPITVLSPRYGYAYVPSNVSINVEVTVNNGSIEKSYSTSGSVLGGALFSLRGLGFSSNCSEISIYVELSGNRKLDASAYILSCSPTVIQGRMPPVGSREILSGFSANVSKFVLVINEKNTSFNHFQYSYSDAATPKLLNLSYVAGALSMRISSPFSTSALELFPSVYLYDGTPLSGLTISRTVEMSSRIVFDITGKIPFLPQGTYSIFVNIINFGNTAGFSGNVTLPYIISAFSANNMFSPPVSSVMGGLTVTVTGNGFSSSLLLSVGGLPCAVRIISPTQLSFETPAVRTVSFVDRLEFAGVRNDLIETINVVDSSIASAFSSKSSDTAFAFDSKYSTYFIDHNNLNCFIGIKMLGSYRIKPYRMRFYPQFQTASKISTVFFEGSKDGGSTYSLLASRWSAHEGWNFIDAASFSGWYTHLRYKVSDVYSYYKSKCSIAEVKFLGVVATIQSLQPVVIFEPASYKSFQIGNISYADLGRTPNVLSIIPSSGSSLGGTTVSLFGSFGFTSSLPSVSLNSIDCNVTFWSTSRIECISGYRSPDNILSETVKVSIPGYGFSMTGDNVTYTYIDKWSDLRSWKNKRQPIDGDFVWIPVGQTLLLDQDTPNLLFLLIQGELRLDSSVNHISIQSKYIFVYGGRFEIGTEANPYESNVTITLHGDRFKDIDLPEIGVKCLAVASLGLPTNSEDSGAHITARNVGQLEIHGKKRVRTWTKLASTANAGDNYFITSEPVDFAPGERLVLSGTQLDSDDFSIDEVEVLANIDNYRIIIKEPLKYTHKSEILTIAGKSVDMRGAVGLLSRNIIIRGDDDSVGQLFGVHVVSRMFSIFRIENAEIMHCGQAFILGRYCTHSHKGGDMEGSYIKANSIHHSFQRAVTTHDTSYWEVRDNVAYDVIGHTYFIEDGAERYNTLSGNLGIRTKPCSACLSSDHKPAVFWTSTPTNFWYDNFAANSDKFGFWFEFSERPTNFLADGEFDICPVHEALGEFSNNTVTANSAIGFRIYPEYTPYVTPCFPYSDASPQDLHTLVSFRNGMGFFNKRAGDTHHIDYSLVENYGDGMSIVKFQTYYLSMQPNVLRALIVGSLDPWFTSTSYLGDKNAIRLPQNEYFYVKDIIVVNFGTSAAFSGCNSCDLGLEFSQGGFTTRFQNVTFIKSTRRIGWKPHFKEIFWDLDGTLTGENGGMITKNYRYNRWPECYVANPVVFDDSLICNNKSKIRRLALDYFSPSSLAYNSLSLISSAGKDEIPFYPLDIYGWVMPVVDNHEYLFQWNSSVQSAQSYYVKFSSYWYLLETYKAGVNESIIASFISYSTDYIAYTYTNNLYSKEYWVSRDVSVALSSPMGASSYSTSTRKLSIVLSTSYADFSKWDDVCRIGTTARLCPPEGCNAPPKAEVKVYSMWSNSSSWNSSVGIPKAGQDVVVPATSWIVLDVSTPFLGCLTIYGKLSFLSNTSMDISLNVQCIKLFGSLEINGFITSSGYNEANIPFNGTASIILYGTRGNSVPVVMGEGLFIGSKLIAVAGVLNIKGKTRSVYQARLKDTANAGTTSITVLSSSPLTWVIGDEIVISSTGYFSESGLIWSNHTSPGNEKRMIKTISFIVQGTVVTSTIFLDSPLKSTHVCMSSTNESFCAIVGLLSRNVRILSQDISGPDEGFGGHISVIDISDGTSNSYVGQITLDSVQLKNIGKLNSNYYGVGISYRSIPSSVLSNSITNCAFVDNYNFAVRTVSTINTVIRGNVIHEVFGGGIFIDSDSVGVTVSYNLILSLHQVPSVYLNGYLWTQPIAAFTFNSFNGTFSNNVVAGSFDTGFSVATSVFSGYNGKRLMKTTGFYDSIKSIKPCSLTRGSEININVNRLLASSIFSNNEAVACRIGLMVVNEDIKESETSTCAVVSGMKAWRNAHIGIGGVDAIANTLITNVVVAENHIGISFSYFRTDDSGFSGVLNSKVIGSLSSTCNLSPGTSWIQKCQVFSENDPFGLSSECHSVLGKTKYSRVGLMIPQFTNGAKTCRIRDRFQSGTCSPSLTPDRLCGLPWEKRYGLPAESVHAEFHISNNTFFGFVSNMSCYGAYGAAVAINPSQIDKQPVLISSSLSWLGEATGSMDMKARLGVSTSGYDCVSGDCMGHHFLLIHDYRGFLLRAADSYILDAQSRLDISGQIIFDNPSYASSTCVSGSSLGPAFIICLPSSSFKQYSGLWEDNEENAKVSIGPILIRRSESLGDNIFRSHAAHAANTDPCPMILPSNRFDLLIAPGFYHKISATGAMPVSWFIRWDAPSYNNSAVLDFFIPDSKQIDVYIGPSKFGPFTRMASQVDSPTLSDFDGTNSRNPQSRNLTMTIRGSPNPKYYMLRYTPIIAVTVRMSLTLTNFFTNTFVANIALLLGISPSRIAIVSVRSGSVIVDFTVAPAEPNIFSNDTIIAQVENLRTLATQLNQTSIQSVLNISVLSLNVTPPVLPTFSPTTNPSTIPTIRPTSRPTLPPTSSPTVSPSSTPSAVPSTRPTSSPSNKPTILPSLSPSSGPTVIPSAYPTTKPTVAPSLISPTASPTSLPTVLPSVIPSTGPTNQPSFDPSVSPTFCPTTLIPTQVPSVGPSAPPTAYPSTSPTLQPTTDPSYTPSMAPSTNPTSAPTSFPTTAPSVAPSVNPSFAPSLFPTANPSNVPSAAPSASPTIGPTSTPTVTPSVTPSDMPTIVPSAYPSVSPTLVPTSNPSIAPSMRPSVNPTSLPTESPTATPSSAPSDDPTANPSFVPSIAPSVNPTTGPTLFPTATPSAAPSNDPSISPTVLPTEIPSYIPSMGPSVNPTSGPTSHPTATPSFAPTVDPSVSPTLVPTANPSIAPSMRPSVNPTSLPTASPTATPSSAPSDDPTANPSFVPSIAPSVNPTTGPTLFPTATPSAAPSNDPSISPTVLPTEIPSYIPSMGPSVNPTSGPTSHPTATPSFAPSVEPSVSPTLIPTANPSIAPSMRPSVNPTSSPTASPTATPSSAPSDDPTANPTTGPTLLPTVTPSAAPSNDPSISPTIFPTANPSAIPSMGPSLNPTAGPTVPPTTSPSVAPSVDPTLLPTVNPTNVPSAVPSVSPTTEPTAAPTATPSIAPSVDPSLSPSLLPTANPSCIPSMGPSANPTNRPTITPSYFPSVPPSVDPTISPTLIPTAKPSNAPSRRPLANPTTGPSLFPTASPSAASSVYPTLSPTKNPTANPSYVPSSAPSMNPTTGPTAPPSTIPSAEPSLNPTAAPSSLPSAIPTNLPSSAPSTNPTIKPSVSPSTSPTSAPLASPSKSPTGKPSAKSSFKPSMVPSFFPTARPTISPTAASSFLPSFIPSITPTRIPSTALPTVLPTNRPTTIMPTTAPIFRPSFAPSIRPSAFSTASPSLIQTTQPIITPTIRMTSVPSLLPSNLPTSVYPTARPPVSPSTSPSIIQSPRPTTIPSAYPFARPTLAPSVAQTIVPSGKPSIKPTAFYPTFQPTPISTAFYYICPPRELNNISCCRGRLFITFPFTMVNIPADAMRGCKSVVKVFFPRVVKTIGNYAFSNCSRLSSIYLGSSVSSIGVKSFSDSLLSTITLPESLSFISYAAFFSCRNLSVVTFGSNVQSIGGYAFYFTSLISVTIPSKTTVQPFGFPFKTKILRSTSKPSATPSKSQ